MSKDIFTVQLVITIALSIIDIGTIILIFDIAAVSNIFRKALERHASATFPLLVLIIKRMLMLFFLRYGCLETRGEYHIDVKWGGLNGILKPRIGLLGGFLRH